MLETPFGPKPGPARRRRFDEQAAAALAAAWRTRYLRWFTIAGVLSGAGLAVGRFWGHAALVPFLAFCMVMHVLGFIDTSTGFVPNVVLYPASVVGGVALVAAAIVDGDGSGQTAAIIVRIVAGATLSFCCAHLVWKFSDGGFGYGDVRLCAYMGAHAAYLSMWLVPAMFLVSFALASLLGVALLFVKLRVRARSGQFGLTMFNIWRHAKDTRFPLVPSFVAGALFTIGVPALALWPLGIDVPAGVL